MSSKPAIAFIGSRGIPPRYGGAEVFVYEVAKRLRDEFDVYVVCEGDRFGMDEYEGIKRVHIWGKHTPTMTIPAVYDIVATLYLLKKAPHVKIYYYVAPDGAYAAVIARLARRKVVVNTDGIEWKRLLIRMRYVPWISKPIYLATAVLMFIAEFLASKIPHVTIADSLAIQHYLRHRWKPKNVQYVAYGIRKLPPVDEKEQLKILSQLGLERYGYYLTVGRIVAENGLHVAIAAFKQVATNHKLVIVGPLNPKDPYVKHLFKLRGADRRIIFTGGIYDEKILYTLRANCRAYIHPYTVGGTNPSLLEQLQFDTPIIAYDVPFHREILRESGIYFTTIEELVKKLEKLENYKINKIVSNFKHDNIYTWSFVSKRYGSIFKKLILLK